MIFVMRPCIYKKVSTPMFDDLFQDDGFGTNVFQVHTRIL